MYLCIDIETNKSLFYHGIYRYSKHTNTWVLMLNEYSTQLINSFPTFLHDIQTDVILD